MKCMNYRSVNNNNCTSNTLSGSSSNTSSILKELPVLPSEIETEGFKYLLFLSHSHFVCYFVFYLKNLRSRKLFLAKKLIYSCTLLRLLIFADVIFYAKLIGIDPIAECELLWIAKAGLLSSLPPGWIAV